MGCYDTIKLKCPTCGKADYHAQSKSGLCLCIYYESLAETPPEVLCDVNRHAPFRCDCGAIFEVRWVDGQPKEAICEDRPATDHLGVDKIIQDIEGKRGAK